MVVIPSDAPPGDYRLCTGNSRPNICTPLRIAQEGTGSRVDLLHHSLTFETGVPTGELETKTPALPFSTVSTGV